MKPTPLLDQIEIARSTTPAVVAELFRLSGLVAERRSLNCGTAPAVGQRVVTVRDVAEEWGMPHAHDDDVHEITSLLGGDCHLVECGPKQIGVRMLRLAPVGAAVTCGQCLGWHAQRERWRIDAEVFRERQVAERLASGDRIKAAAPDLLAACEEVAAALERLGYQGNPGECPTNNALAAVRSSIEAAKGGAR